MSEQLDPTTDRLREDDPLVELARIVSGEDADARGEPSAEEAPTRSPVADDFSTDLEAELMLELGGSEANAKPAPVASTSESAVKENPVPANQPDEGVFHDELLQALQDEVQPAKPERVELPPESVKTEESQDNVTPEPAMKPAEAPVRKPAEQAAVVKTVPDEISEKETVTAAQDPSADLGSAFAAEFEQMIERDEPSNVEQSTEVPQTPRLEEPSSAAVAAEQEERVSEQSVAEQPREQEIDARFAASTAAVREELSQEAAKRQMIRSWILRRSLGPPLQKSLVWNPCQLSKVGNLPSLLKRNPDFVAEGGALGVAATDPGYADGMTDTQTSGAQGQGGKRYAVAALAIALVAGLGAAGYGFFDGSASVDGQSPIIKADTDPVKVKPEDPGGRQVANQDKASYEKVADTGAESNNQDTLISDTEEPADLVALAEPKSDERLTADTTEPEPESTAGVEPRKVRTVTVKPDGTILLPESVDTLSSTPSLAAVSPEPVVSTATAAIDESVGIDGAKSSLDIAVPSVSPVSKPDPVELASTNVEEAVEIAPTPVEPTPEPVEVEAASTSEGATDVATQRSEWAVQVSSQRSPEAAQASYQNLRNRFGSIFEGRSMAIQRAVVEDKGTFYRVRIQTASKSDATQFCSKFKASGGSCFVTR